MIKKFESVNELYAFFVPNLIKPPYTPKCICSGIQLDRPGWHVEIYRRSADASMSMWFYSHPNRGPEWLVWYAKFKNPPQES